MCENALKHPAHSRLQAEQIRIQTSGGYAFSRPSLHQFRDHLPLFGRCWYSLFRAPCHYAQRMIQSPKVSGRL